MLPLGSQSGLTPRLPSPPTGASEPALVLTEEAGVRAPSGGTPRVTPLVAEDELVARGAPLVRLRDAPEVRLVAPMAGRVARIVLRPGQRLAEIVLFGEAGGEVVTHRLEEAGSESGLRRLMQHAGIWPWIGRRPFGGMPGMSERPAAVVVMALDTKPFAPDPRRALEGREEAFARGLQALATLTDGSVFVCGRPGPPLFEDGLGQGRVRTVHCGSRHPQGSAGIRVHDLAPAAIDAPVWDVHAEDVAALGELLGSGVVPMTRLVSVAGEALAEGALVRTQPGADLRKLTRRIVTPGAHVLMSGSPLDGHEAHWLGPRERQVSVLPRRARRGSAHWLVAALTRSARPTPLVPTAALAQAFGAALPAVPFLRALSAGDEESATKLGLLSLLEEDLALADYVLGGEARLAGLLRVMLDRVRTELAA